MAVGQASLLEFYDMDMCHRHTQNMAVLDVTQQFSKVEVIYPGH
jgi:hypothetical protein